MGERRIVTIIGTCLVLIVMLISAWLLLPGSTANSAPLAEVTDKAQIADCVQLSHVGIMTSENYFGMKVRLIGGNLKNVSTKPIRAVDLRMIFSDYDGKPVLDSVQKGFASVQKPLQPGDQYHFEVGFDVLPKNWNYHEPAIEIVKVGY